MNDTDTVNLSNCDREPIHIPGSIQSHGCLLACDATAVKVLRHSANAGRMLRYEHDLNGTQLQDIVGNAAAHDIRNALAAAPEAARPALIPKLKIGNGDCFDISVHSHRGNAIIEFEPCSTNVEPLHVARELIGRIKDVDDTRDLIGKSVRLLRAVLGYDRVMIYRFEKDGAGKVEAESKRSDLESFLGQYFPASDIPQQARALYLRNSIRVISDASGSREPVEPVLDASGEPLDLSFAHLRSVSPIHLEYLRNMGVAASMSISVIIDNTLWGLIACHHYQPKALTMGERVAAEMFGEFYSMHLIALQQKQKLEAVTAARRALDRFLESANEQADVARLMVESLPDFMTLMPCDGVGLYMNGKWNALGSAPPAAAAAKLARFVGSVADSRIWANHCLSQVYPPAEVFFEDAAGLLAIPLSQLPRDYLFFFRKERLQTLAWAGNPQKSYESGPLGDRLTPRKSFAIWKETVERQSEHWSDADREIADAIRAAAVEVVLRHNEMMEEERNKSDVRQRLLNEELNHRVKNILAVIRSLVTAPTRDEQTLEDYVSTLKGRIQALALAHDQVIRGSGGGSIRGLLEAELMPYIDGNVSIHLSGEDVMLETRAYAVAALVLHELATNAVKYGALSRAAGRLDVSWKVEADGDCHLTWRESGGPAVAQPRRRGFGTALIDRSIPFDLGGRSTIAFKPAGVEAEFVLPAKFVTQAEARGPAWGRPVDTETAAAERSDISKAAVLLVEDQMLIAMDAEMMLASAGIETVITASSSSDALAKLRNFAPDVAMLDINLGSDTSVPVAEELERRGIPFVFATGYNERNAMLPEHLLAVPVVRKPYDTATLVDALRTRLTPSDDQA